jgi:hypothetical protein
LAISRQPCQLRPTEKVVAMMMAAALPSTCVCVLASGSRGSVVITRYQSLPLTPSKVLPICVTQ